MFSSLRHRRAETVSTNRFADEEDEKRGNRVKQNHIWLLAIAGAAAVLLLYVALFPPVVRLKILSLNVWAMPLGLGGCRDVRPRLRGLARLLRRTAFDVVLLQELWMERDHAFLADLVRPDGYHATAYRATSHWACDGRVGPGLCSGLAVLARRPLEDVAFAVFAEPRGSVWDGEAFAGKGVVRARVRTDAGFAVDVFNTHLVAVSDGDGDDANSWYRRRQMEELAGTVLAADGHADVVVVGGDLNSEAVPDELKASMSNCDANGDVAATYGNGNNTYSAAEAPVRIDHLLFGSNRDSVDVWSEGCEAPLFRTSLSETDEDRLVSLSDHEALVATLCIRSSVFPTFLTGE